MRSVLAAGFTILVVIGGAVTGYAIGQAGVADASDAEDARRSAAADSFDSARVAAFKRAQTRGHSDGIAAGRKAGETDGTSAGSQRGATKVEDAQAELAAVEEAAQPAFPSGYGDFYRQLPEGVPPATSGSCPEPLGLAPNGGCYPPEGDGP